jgi:hypothetical protein
MVIGTGVGLDKGIVIRAMTYRLDVYCLRCEGYYAEYRPDRDLMPIMGIPDSLDPADWRAYLARLGWTEGGTVCLSCSEEPT